MTIKSAIRVFIGFGALVTAFNGCNDREPGIFVPSGVVYTAVKTDTPPVMDGIINDPCWEKAKSASLVLSVDGKTPDLPANVRMLYDDSMLYIGFECRDTDAASNVTLRDGPIDDGDYIEIRIDADADSVTFASIKIAPTGAVLDAFILRGRDGMMTKTMRDWNCEALRVSISIYGGGARPGTDDRFWTVESAIPFAEMLTAPVLPPRNGCFWRFAVLRNDITGTVQCSAFPPVEDPQTITPSQFAWLKFGD